MVIPLLKTLVTQQSDMNLQEVINLPDKLLDFTADMKLPVPLYAQGLTFVFTNNFVNTYAYLRALEDLKWMIFWDELQYVVGQYPNAEVKLTLHTVSKEKEN
jgi:MSHA biogenesis protein MshJ